MARSQASLEALAPWLEDRQLRVGECGAVQIFTGQVMMGRVHLPQALGGGGGDTHSWISFIDT